MLNRSAKNVPNGLLSLVHSASTPILHDQLPDISGGSTPILGRRTHSQQQQQQETAFAGRLRAGGNANINNDGSFVTHISIGAHSTTQEQQDANIMPVFSLNVPTINGVAAAVPSLPGRNRNRSDSLTSIQSDGVS